MNLRYNPVIKLFSVTPAEDLKGNRAILESNLNLLEAHSIEQMEDLILSYLEEKNFSAVLLAVIKKLILEDVQEHCKGWQSTYDKQQVMRTRLARLGANDSKELLKLKDQAKGVYASLVNHFYPGHLWY